MWAVLKRRQITMEPSMFLPSAPQVSQHLKQAPLRNPPTDAAAGLPGLPELQRLCHFVLRGRQYCDWMEPDSRQGATVSECMSVTPDELEEAPDRFFCPISLDMMTDPVLLVCTGQVYDYPSLMAWFESGGRNCPMTGLHLPSKITLKVDNALREDISAWWRTRGKNPDAIRAAALLARHGGTTDECGDRAVSRQRKHCGRALRRAVVSKFVSFMKAGYRQYAGIY